MKKIFQWLSGSVIKDVGNVIDKLTTTDEERLAAKQKIQELLEQADKDARIRTYIFAAERPRQAHAVRDAQDQMLDRP